MKNGKKAISLVFTALAVVSLSGCSDVTSNSDGQILTYTYQGQHLDISTDDIIQQYLTESRDEHAKAFYDALYEIVVRASFEKGGALSTYKEAVEATARDTVEEAKDSADNSGTELTLNSIANSKLGLFQMMRYNNNTMLFGALMVISIKNFLTM